MVLRPVELPEGGAPHGLLALDQGDASALLALTPRALFARDARDASWSAQPARWANPDDFAPITPAEALSQLIVHTDARGRLTSWRGRAWALVKPKPDGLTTLIWADERGARWHVAALPAHEARDAQQRLDNLRIMTSDDALILLDRDAVWIARALDPDGHPAWESISLTGRDAAEEQADVSLTTVRHYLPATSARPWELLTVISRSLLIYQRREGESWRLVDKRSGVDRQVVVTPDSSRVYLVIQHQVFYTEDGARWLLSSAPVLTNPWEQINAILPLTDPSSGQQALLLGLDDGTIWRQESPTGAWTKVRPADADRRGIAHLVKPATSPTLWASTRGQGALRSDDGGRTWTSANEGLRAATPLTIERDAKGALLVGTAAGLFELQGSPSAPTWRRRHERSASALMEIPFKLLFTGTTNGSILIEANETQTTEETGRIEPERRELRYEPASAIGLPLPDAAIVSIIRRPQSSEVYAISRGDGMMRSAAGGRGWSMIQLDSQLRDELKHAHLSSVALGPDGWRAMTARSLVPPRREQLWISGHDADTWRAVQTLPDSEDPTSSLRLFTLPDADAGTMLLAHEQRLARSRDHGITWAEIEGPWSRDPIKAMTLTQEGALVLTRTQQRFALHHLNLLDDASPVTTTAVTWSYLAGHTPEAILNIRLGEQHLFAQTPTQLLWATRPEHSGAHLNLTVALFTLTCLIGITAAALVALRSRRR
jgi:photosystem II stability/assembly factor-like uncharacterized protein